MKLKDVKPGMEYAYFCRKNKVICHVPASCVDDGACQIIETVLPDGEIMGPLLYSEACYLTPVTDRAPWAVKAFLMDVNAGQLSALIGVWCTSFRLETPQPARLTKGDDWEVIGGRIAADDFIGLLNAADLAAMTEALNNAN